MSRPTSPLMFWELLVLVLLCTGCGGEERRGDDDDDGANDDDDAVGSCDPTGLWTIHLIPSLEEPDGCGSAGIVAQSEADHIIQVSGTGPGDWTALLLEPSSEGLDSSVLTVEFAGGQGACEITMGLENTVTMPTPVGLATVVLDYNHSANTDADGEISGAGSVHFYSTETSPLGDATVLQDCTEPFELGGTFVSEG